MYTFHIATILKEKNLIYFVEYSSGLWSYPFNTATILKEKKILFVL